MTVNIFDNPLETPLLQGSHMASLLLKIALSGSASSFRMEAGASDRNGKPEGLHTILVPALLRGYATRSNSPSGSLDAVRDNP